MSLPIELRFDVVVFKIGLLLCAVGIPFFVAIVFITALFDGYLLKLFQEWNFIRVFLPSIILIAMFVIPIFIGSLVHPIGNNKLNHLVRGGIVLGLSSVLFYIILGLLPKLELYPYDELDTLDKLIVTLCFIVINLTLYLPSILKIDKEA